MFILAMRARSEDTQKRAWGKVHSIMIRDKDYSLQTCQQFIFVNQASCYKNTYTKPTTNTTGKERRRHGLSKKVLEHFY